MSHPVLIVWQPYHSATPDPKKSEWIILSPTIFSIPNVFHEKNNLIPAIYITSFLCKYNYIFIVLQSIIIFILMNSK